MNEERKKHGRAALILAGGVGVRMGSEFSGMPKCLAEISGTPIIALILRWLERQGYRKIVLSTRPEFAAAIRKAARGHTREKIQVIANPKHVESLIGALQAVPQLSGLLEPFLLVLADILFAERVRLKLEARETDCLYGQFLSREPGGAKITQGLVAYDLQTHEVLRIDKFGVADRTNGVMQWSGMAHCGTFFWKDVREFSQNRDMKTLHLEDLFAFRIRRGRRAVAKNSGPFVNINTPDDLHAAKALRPQSH